MIAVVAGDLERGPGSTSRPEPGPAPVRICTVDGCGRKHKARGLCNMHHQRWLAHGDPAALAPKGPRYAESATPLQSYLWSASGRVLAERLGVSRRTIVRWRQGGRIGDPDRVATAMGRHPSEIWP